MVNEAGALIIENVIVGNTADVGAGVSASVPSGDTGPTLINNTIANNNARQLTGSGIFMQGFDSQAVLVNNIVVAPSGQQAITCDGTYSTLSPFFSYNDVYGGGSQAWAGTCNYTTNPGNISVDPLFVNPAVSNYHLQPGSPAINVGNNSAPNFPAADFDGNPRIYNLTVDLGAYEYQGPTTLSFSPTNLPFPSQLVGGASQPMSVTLTNTGNTALQISSIAASTGFPETDTCQTANGLAAGQTCQINVEFTPTQPDYQAGGISVSANITSGTASVSVSGTGVANSGGSSANFLGTDSTTSGNWSANYGADGYSIANGPQNLPTYDPSFSALGQQNWTWLASTTDPRALKLPGGAGSIAATWYNETNFTFDVNITDGNPHQVALYVLDWDQQNRSEMVQVVDAASGASLSSSSISNFGNGEYLIWTISGHVRINISTSGGPNCVVSGVFFGGAVVAPPASPSLGISKAHSGHVLQGQQGLTYTVSVSNALNAGTTSGAVTVTESIPSGLTLVSMTGNHWTCPANATYCTRSDSLDAGLSYDPITVTVNVASNASSPQVNQVTVSGGGSASANASDPTIIESTGGSGGATATFVAQDNRTQGAWLGVYGGDGYSLANSVQSLPSYDPSFAVQNQQTWTWASGTTDPRALQVPGRASGYRGRVVQQHRFQRRCESHRRQFSPGRSVSAGLGPTGSFGDRASGGRQFQHRACFHDRFKFWQRRLSGLDHLRPRKNQRLLYQCIERRRERRLLWRRWFAPSAFVRNRKLGHRRRRDARQLDWPLWHPRLFAIHEQSKHLNTRGAGDHESVQLELGCEHVRSAGT